MEIKNEEDIKKIKLKNKGESKKIITEGSIGFVYHNQLIYYQDSEEKYYMYNFDKNITKPVSNIIGAGALDVDYIVPIDDKLYTFNGLDLYVYDGDKINKYHSFTCNDFKDLIPKCTEKGILVAINSIDKSSTNSLMLGFGDVVDGELYVALFNLDTKKLTLVEDGGYYSSTYYVK